jgi:TfoX/Sxy family transcriptional regulator of competence genes
MAFDEALAERVRTVLGDAPDVVGRRMFGGVAFMVAGNMACGVMGDDLLVRVGKEDRAACLVRPHVRAMELSGRVMGGFVVVDADALDEDEVLEDWVERGCAYAGSLPPR